MNSWHSFLFPVFLLAASSAFAGEKNEPTDGTLIQFAQNRTNAVRITESPYQMQRWAMIRCRGPSPEEWRVLKKEQATGVSDPHIKKYVHVYVSPDGKAAMQTNSGVFPQGAIVLKEKFSDAEGNKTELFTGMIKREIGYNPECGDWEFFTLSADVSKITSRGKLQDCMTCHVEYKNQDFVTKSYAHISFYRKPAATPGK